MRLLGKKAPVVLNQTIVNTPTKPERSTQEKICDVVADYVLLHYDELVELEAEDVYVISFSREIGRAWSAWVNTTVDDNRLYQVIRTDAGKVIVNVFEKVDGFTRPAAELGL